MTTRQDIFTMSNLKCLVSPVLLAIISVITGCQNPANEKIDRYALVNRHNIEVNQIDPLASLSVGNGNFAFTTDITGLQTFYREYEDGVALGTMSNRGWHYFPNDGNYQMEETWLMHQVAGRQVPYEHQLRTSPRAMEAVNHFRENPHRLHLGIIRLVIRKANGSEISPEDIINASHRLNLWEGAIESSFEVEGHQVTVKVFAHQDLDILSARIESDLVGSQRLSIEWLFPYGLGVHTHAGYQFGSPEKHTSLLRRTGETSATIKRTLDSDTYYTSLIWKPGSVFEEEEKHRFIMKPSSGNQVIEFSCLFSPEEYSGQVPGFEETRQNNIDFWKNFWETGGAVDFSQCTDPRAPEIERRAVLSQYLTRINGSGDLPPQETGLTFNSWYGKFHLEMIWWHSAHFYNWQRPQLMADQLEYYHQIYETSAEFTRLQGYKGVRWPKMVGPNGINSPSSVGSYLIWQQPHLIYLAEQLYRSGQFPGILEKYAGLIFETAEFMADFAAYHPESDTYGLYPPLIPAQEHWDRLTTENPPFELAYWHWGLTAAQQWKQRLGLPPDPHWEEVRNKLAAPVAANGVYPGTGNAPESYTRPENLRDHPMVLGMVGMLPEWERIDREVLRNTLLLIMGQWDWDHTWGWDYPMVAMCATRLLEPEIALDALLKEVQKNRYLVNGHNYQDERLRIYLPGNGGFLKAIALMCAGWEGCTTPNPGFPKDGNWNVRWENLTPDF
jgi:hypothetical protein